jgi:hypothetical protein
MRIFVVATALLASASLYASSANAINIGPGLKPALDATDMTGKVAVFIVEGRRYCFYFNGWHGPGWYRCGFAWRRNLGWGGEYGWQNWSYRPAERRYGHGGSALRGTVERPSSDTTTIRRGGHLRGSDEGREISRGSQMQKNAAPVEGNQGRRGGGGQGIRDGGGQVGGKGVSQGGGQAVRQGGGQGVRQGGGQAGGSQGGGQGAGGGRGGGQGGVQGGGQGGGGGGEKR